MMRKRSHPAVFHAREPARGGNAESGAMTRGSSHGEEVAPCAAGEGVVGLPCQEGGARRHARVVWLAVHAQGSRDRVENSGWRRLALPDRRESVLSVGLAWFEVDASGAPLKQAAA